ncbi:3731_t:CDS:10, partial [Acaulospora morrowiae]
EFITLYNESISLRNKIDTLFMEADGVSREVNDPEVGMKPKLLKALKENRLVKQEVQNTKFVVEMLEYLSELRTSEKRFQEYMSQGRIEEAAGIITEMDRLLESPPIQSSQQIHILDRLKMQLTSMKESLDQNLDDLLNEAICFKKTGADDADGFNLSVLSAVEKDNSTTLLTSVFISLTEIDSINMQLSRLKKNVMKYLVTPLLKHQNVWKASIKIEGDLKASLFIGSTLEGENIVDSSQDGVFKSLTVIFQFIYTFIFGGIDPISKETLIFSIASQYASTFGKFIAHDLRDIVISEYLSHVIPTEISEFKRFEEVSNAVRCFQSEMRRMGFMRTPQEGEEEEESTLGAYVAKVDILFTIKKRDKLLELGRKIMLDESFESLSITKEESEAIIEEMDVAKIAEDELETENRQNGADTTTQSNPNEGWEVDWNEEWDDDGWGKDDSSNQNGASNKKNSGESYEVEKEPMKYAITVKSKPLIDLTINTLNEARNLNPKSGIRLYQATLDLFDLYRAIMPVYHSEDFVNDPSLTMLFRNDCVWLADQLITVQDDYINCLSSLDSNNLDGGNNKILYNEAADRLRELGSEWWDIQLDKQKSLFRKDLDEMGGVQQSANDERFEICQRTMNKIVDKMNHLSRILKGILLPTEYYSILGILVDEVLTIMIENLEDLYDISAEESNQLNLIYSRLLILENIFNKNKPNTIENNVKSWNKFRQITDILVLSFAEIMNRFRASELDCFTTKELEGLICALFADTELRERNLQEINDGHPHRGNR